MSELGCQSIILRIPESEYGNVPSDPMAVASYIWQGLKEAGVPVKFSVGTNVEVERGRLEYWVDPQTLEKCYRWKEVVE